MFGALIVIIFYRNLSVYVETRMLVNSYQC